MLAPKDEGVWRIEAHDTFSGEDYPLEGSWRDEDTARQEACNRVKELLISQSSAGILRDKIYIVRPDGSKYRWYRSEM